MFDFTAPLPLAVGYTHHIAARLSHKTDKACGLFLGLGVQRR